MDLLKRKVVLITGCSRGIGKAIIYRFAEEGAIIYANSRETGDLFTIKDELKERYNAVVVPVIFDVCDKNAVKQCIQQIKEEQGRLDVLVNNAGVMKDALLGMIENQTMNMIFDVNVYALINISQMAYRLMKRTGGSIINMCSIVGMRGNSGQTVYSASKGAVAALTLTWARELVKDGIRVNAIAPGKIDTDMFKSIGEARVKEATVDIGMGRLGKPEEVANVAVFLASDLASYVTGEIIGVNGGWFL